MGWDGIGWEYVLGRRGDGREGELWCVRFKYHIRVDDLFCSVLVRVRGRNA